jgi:hypothetical protein
MDAELGLSERDKELKQWNKPYVYREFPRMLYRAATVAGKVEVEQRIVGSEGEAALATGTGWLPSPSRAQEAEVARQEGLGTAAAERAWGDRRMSAGAQAEAAAVDETTLRHLPEIAERPRRSRKSTDA